MLIPLTGSRIITYRDYGHEKETLASTKYSNMLPATKGELRKLGIVKPYLFDGHASYIVSPSQYGDMLTLHDIESRNSHYVSPRIRLGRLQYQGFRTSLMPINHREYKELLKRNPQDSHRSIALASGLRYPKPWLNSMAGVDLRTIQVLWEALYGVMSDAFLSCVDDEFYLVNNKGTTQLESETYHEAFFEALKK